MKSYNFLFWAYNIIWLGLSGYVMFNFMRLRKVEARLEGLERELSREASTEKP